MTYRRLLSPVLAFALPALVGLAMPAGAVTTQSDYPFAGAEFFDMCTGEPVLVTGGYDHEIVNVSSNANGGFHIDFHGNLHDVVGVGETTGAPYKITGDYHNSFDVPTGALYPYTATFTEHVGIISPGSGPNDELVIVEHITVNADGTVTSTVDKISETCKG